MFIFKHILVRTNKSNNCFNFVTNVSYAIYALNIMIFTNIVKMYIYIYIKCLYIIYIYKHML